MGSLRQFDLGRIIRDYRVQNLFETGTFRGDGISYALQWPFKKIISVEIVADIARDAAARFHGEQKVEVIQDDSVSALRHALPALQGPCIFWLDAHYPGADAGLTAYDAADESLRLPLEKELEAITEIRKEGRDVFLIDDLRIYEDGDFENGNVPADARPKTARHIDFVHRFFGHSHKLLRCYKDEGYILLFPKKMYRTKHFHFSNWFGKPLEDDYYLVRENGAAAS